MADRCIIYALTWLKCVWCGQSERNIYSRHMQEQKSDRRSKVGSWVWVWMLLNMWRGRVQSKTGFPQSYPKFVADTETQVVVQQSGPVTVYALPITISQLSSFRVHSSLVPDFQQKRIMLEQRRSLFFKSMSVTQSTEGLRQNKTYLWLLGWRLLLDAGDDFKGNCSLRLGLNIGKGKTDTAV